MKNIFCSDTRQIITRATKPKVEQFTQVRWRPKSKEAREKFFEIGGSRWLDRVINGLVGK